MTDVFISYAREDRARIEKLAAALDAEGVAVWWDKNLSGGADFSKETEARLNAAKAIVVAWSKVSIDSMWVGDEAAVGREKGNLIPVAIDAVAPKIGFRGIHTIDLSNWRGDATASTFQDLVRVLKGRIGGEAPPAAVTPRPRRIKPALLAAMGLGAALLVGLGLFFAKPFDAAEPAAQGAGTLAASAPQAPATSISIAVLPFANMSGDAAQEFFSDGMTEEITSALAKVPDLRVVARASAFQFKGEKKDMRAVGQTLSARYLIDGSVRRAGTRVRISASLIEANNGLQIWTEIYDRELTDVFAIQEDIAMAIAASLRVPLGLKGPLVASRTQDPEAYQQYLQAKTLVRRSGGQAFTGAIALLEQVVAREPNFAPAWALLGRAYTGIVGAQPPTTTVEDMRRIMEVNLPKAEAAVRRAIELDPNDANGYLSLSSVQRSRGQYLAAIENVSKALTLDPQNSDTLNSYGMLLASVGRPKESLAVMQQLRAVEPSDLVFSLNTAGVMWLNGQNDAAIALLKILDSDARFRPLAMIYASMGRYGDAADAVLEISPIQVTAETKETAVRLLRAAPAPAASPQSLPFLVVLNWVYLYVGAPERSLEHVERFVERGFIVPTVLNPLWHPSYAAVRKTERFKALVRKAGLVEYWQAKGWPEFCHPVGKDDFACDQ